MRHLAIALLVACSSTSTHYRYDTRIGTDRLYIVIERETTKTTSTLDPADKTYDSSTDVLAVVEVDFATGKCERRGASHAMQRGERGFADFTGTNALRVEQRALIHASGAQLATYGKPLAAGDRIFVYAPSRAWIVVDLELRILDTIAFPLGRLAALAPETAVFASPHGTIPFRGDQSGAPVTGVEPPAAPHAWWHRKRPLAPGDAVRTPKGHQLSASTEGGRLYLDIVWARGHRARYPATRIIYFERSELVSIGDSVVDVEWNDAVYPIAVTEAFAYTRPVCCDGAYFLLANGEVWHTTVEDMRRSVRPLRMGLSLVAVRGDRLVFQSNKAVALYDLRTRRWQLASYRDCIPEAARD